MLGKALILRSNERHLIDATNYGVPVDSVVRYWNVTPHDPGAKLMPHIFYGQGNSPRMAKLSTTVSLLLWTPENPDPVDVEVNVLVDFIAPPASAERAILLGAVLSHSDEDHRRAIIDAHTAADTAITNAWDEHTGTATRMPFLTRLRVIDELRREHRLPELPQTFQTGLKELNKRRNDVAHPRPEEHTFDEQVAAEALTTATFAVNWAEAAFGLPSRSG